MRALIVFLLVAVSFAVVVMFYPDSDEVQGAGPVHNAADAERASGTLPVEQGSAPITRGFLERDAPAPSTTGQVPEASDDVPDWLAGVQMPDEPVQAAELRLCEALVHGGTEAVERALAGSEASRDRQIMARSFAMALAGDHRNALRLAGDIDEGALPDLERSLLREALGGEASASGVSRSEWRDGRLSRGMGMAIAHRRALAAMRDRRHGAAARHLSDLLLSELEAPWEAHRDALAAWSELLADAQREYRWNPDGGWAAEEVTVEPGDSAISVRKRYLARRPGSLMCAGLILRANAVRGYLQPGQVLRVPIAKASILVDLSARWALYLLGDEVAASWPVGIGRPGEETRTGVFRAGNKLENPPWMKVGQNPVPFGDPENPLGTRWIGWFDGDRATSFGFHGTWKPESIGQASSDGCIRFHNADVEELFEILPEGSPIHVRT